MNKVTILVAHHKPSVQIKNEIFFPIHVGKDISKIDLGIPGDNSGDNISYKNPIYCELTATYWAWKNIESDYVGLCHYRRYFTFKGKSIWEILNGKLKFYTIQLLGNLLHPGANNIYVNQVTTQSLSLFKNIVIDFSSQILSFISDNDIDIIVPCPHHFACNTNRQFFEVLGREHITLIENITKDINPEFYPYLQETLSSNRLYAANMHIMRSNIFRHYCETIFPLLEQHEKLTIERAFCNDLLNEKAYSRVSGYLAEFLTSAYIVMMKDRNKKVKELPTLFLF